MKNIWMGRGVILLGLLSHVVFADEVKPPVQIVAKKFVAKKLRGPAASSNNSDGFVIKSRKNEKTIPCDDTKVQRVRVNFGRITILSFPIAPKEILPGEVVFDFRQIKGDLAIKALKSSARTNIAVYLSERRCSFDLVTVPSGGDDILFVRDPIDRQFEVKFQ